MFVDGGGLGFAEADEVDDVGEDFDEAVVRRFEQVLEAEVVDAALFFVSANKKSHVVSEISILWFFGSRDSIDERKIANVPTSVNSFRSEMKKPIRFRVSAGTISPYSPQTSSPAARMAGSTVSRVVFVNSSANHSNTFWTC